MRIILAQPRGFSAHGVSGAVEADAAAASQ